MTMTTRVRKFALILLITSSVGWLGAIIGFIAHAVAGLTSQDTQTVRAAYLMMDLTGWFVLVPLSLASLLTGVAQSLGTAWGLFRHYWIIAKLSITVISTIVLLIYMQTLDKLVSVAAKTTFSSADFSWHQGASPVIHASVALLLLITCVVLSVYKPWGKTQNGKRKEV